MCLEILRTSRADALRMTSFTSVVAKQDVGKLKKLSSGAKARGNQDVRAGAAALAS
jgi:hypothetical protein